MNVTGLCIEDHDLAEFRYQHQWNDGLFGPGNSGHHFTIKPLSSYLPGQRNLPQKVIEFDDGETALVAVEISRKWKGTTLVKWWRIIYIHPKLEPIFQREVGRYLKDVPIGENERLPQKKENHDE